MLPALVLPPTQQEGPVLIRPPRRLRLPVFELQHISSDHISLTRNVNTAPIKKRTAVLEKIHHSASAANMSSMASSSSTNNNGGNKLDKGPEWRKVHTVFDFLISLAEASKHLKKNEVLYMKKHVGVSLQDIERLEHDIAYLYMHHECRQWKKSQQMFASMQDFTSQAGGQQSITLFMKNKPLAPPRRCMTNDHNNVNSDDDDFTFSDNSATNSSSSTLSRTQSNPAMFSATKSLGNASGFGSDFPGMGGGGGMGGGIGFGNTINSNFGSTFGDSGAFTGIHAMTTADLYANLADYGKVDRRKMTADGRDGNGSRAKKSAINVLGGTGLSVLNSSSLTSSPIHMNTKRLGSSSFTRAGSRAGGTRQGTRGGTRQGTATGGSRRGSDSTKIQYDHQFDIKSLKDTGSLQTELLRSLQNMQAHSDIVKNGILQAQQALQFQEPKIQTFVLKVAAEKLSESLYSVFVRKEVVRGWKAWVGMIAQDKQLDSLRCYIRFQGYRNFSYFLRNKVNAILQRKVNIWSHFAVAETRRIRRNHEVANAGTIQRYFRGYLGRLRALSLHERKTYQSMYESTIILQTLFRGKIHLWRYQLHKRKKQFERCTRFTQRHARGFLGRIRVKQIRKERAQHLAAIKIQALIRGVLVRKVAESIHINHLKDLSATIIQALMRGCIARNNAAKRALAMLQDKCAVRIQTRMRGFLVRSNIDRKRAQLGKHRAGLMRAATQIQAAYRGYRARLIYRMLIMSANREKKLQNQAATTIITMVRGFMCRAQFRKMKADQYEQWLANARAVVETWSEDANAWFYLNNDTGDAAWEPPSEGYTKSDGMLVLANGTIIDDPHDQQEVEDEDDANKREKFCVECTTRVAIRYCNECTDQFCTKCYKDTHALGARKNHTYSALGPLDCTECEQALAERWCVACDEAFCDACWRKVHGHGNRRYHPFSEVSADGSINPRISTMDGEEVLDYQPTHALQMGAAASQASSSYGGDWDGVPAGDYDQQSADASADYGGYYDEAGNWIDTSGAVAGGDNGGWETAGATAGGQGGGEEWMQAYDDDGNLYWYNNYTGVSQYEDPYSGY